MAFSGAGATSPFRAFADDPSCLAALIGSPRNRSLRVSNSNFCTPCLSQSICSSGLNQSVSCCVNSGNSSCTSFHVFWPSTRLRMAAHIVSSSDRTCFILSRSRSVNVLSLTDWKSTVIPRGVPSSSFLE